MMASATDNASIDRLQQRLDQAVAVARAVRWLGWLGRVACIAWLAAIVIAVVSRMFGPPSIAVTAVVWSIAAIAAMLAWRFAAGPRPRRLDVAAAAEAAEPHLGERLSRAVDFLTAATADDASRGFKALAVADAARALDACPRLPVTGLDRHGRWFVAGGMAIIGLVALWAWPGAMAPAVGPGLPDVNGNARPTPPAVAAGAAAIATSAALEARLTAILDARFHDAPGIARDALSAAEQGELDRLAALHADMIPAIERSRAAIVAIAAATPQARAAADLLATIDAAALAAATAAISQHQLATAATITAHTADTLSAAARALGVALDDGDGSADLAAATTPPAVRRLALALDDIASRGGPREASTAPAPVSPPTTAAERRPGPTPQAGSTPANGERSLADRGTTEPRFGTGGAEATPEAATEITSEPAGPVSRAWSLLPARVRPADARRGEPDVPAAYRQAVDLYYKSLLESVPPQ